VSLAGSTDGTYFVNIAWAWKVALTVFAKLQPDFCAAKVNTIVTLGTLQRQ